MSHIEAETEETQLLHDVAEGNGKTPDSLMEQLRAKRQEIAETRSTFIPIAGYESMGLQVNYNLMERKQIEEIGRRVLKETKDRGERQMLILLDTIINATEGFYIQR